MKPVKPENPLAPPAAWLEYLEQIQNLPPELVDQSEISLAEDMLRFAKAIQAQGEVEDLEKTYRYGRIG